MCGILAQYNYNHENSLKLIEFITTLQKIQHRGHDSFGISYLNNDIITISRKGLIKNKLKIADESIYSRCYLGHVRYKTSGNFESNTHQPIYGENKFGQFSFVFNGNLSLPQYNRIFQTNYILDSQLILFVLQKRANCFNNWRELMVYLQNTFDRAFCLIIMTTDKLYVARDRFGVRPLCYVKGDDNIQICSENVAFNQTLSQTSIDVKPGEVLEIYQDKIEHIFTYQNYNLGLCLFEYIYFLHGQTIWNGMEADNFRYDCGIQLGIQETEDQIINHPKNYVVIGIPQTGIIGGEGYAKIRQIPYLQYISKNKNINRTFILREEERDTISKQKYAYHPSLKNKKVIIVDDSIVRGITTKNIVKKLKEMGVKEIHIRVNAPPITNICAYGIDIPKKEELIANNVKLEDLASFLECDSVSYLEIDNIKKILPNFDDLCTGCFNGNYKNLDW